MQGDKQGEAVQVGQSDAQMWLRAICFALARQIGVQGNEMTQYVPSGEGGEAAVDIFETLECTFQEIGEAVLRGEGAEAVRAVRDTLEQIDPIKAAQIADMMPPTTDGTRNGLGSQIGRKRAELAHLDREIRRSTPPAYHDDADGDLWDGRESAETLTSPRHAQRRRTKRDLDALVHAWDVV